MPRSGVSSGAHQKPCGDTAHLAVPSHVPVTVKHVTAHGEAAQQLRFHQRVKTLQAGAAPAPVPAQEGVPRREGAEREQPVRPRAPPAGLAAAAALSPSGDAEPSAPAATGAAPRSPTSRGRPACGDGAVLTISSSVEITLTS